MSISNIEIAASLNELADLLEIAGENPFKIRAYRIAARTISELSHTVEDMIINEEDLTELPGVGEHIAEKVIALVKTGKIPKLKEIQKKLPESLTQLLFIEGLGPKRIKKLHEALNISTLEDLKKAAVQGKIAQLSGFGKKIEKNILQEIKKISERGKRIILHDAKKLSDSIIKFIKNIEGVKKVEIAGSFRRGRETVGDIDILVIAKSNTKIIQKFIKYDDISRIVSKGSTKSTVFLKSGLQVDLRVVPETSYGAALLYFTGSKSHNIIIRKMAIKKHLKINEYGMFKGKKRVAGKTEKEIYNKLGLSFVEPELRENHGEIEAALHNKLPSLITLKDIRGDLHCHTNKTDGQYSLEKMVEAAKKLHYEYIAITDHSQHLTVAHGLNKKELLQQIKVIDQLNKKLFKFKILKSIEVDILENGQLDLPNEVLKELDLTVCSIHYQFNLSQKEQTERVLRAMDNPYFNIFAHPTGRLINRRDPYEIDMERIMKAAKEKNCILEINAQPERMDLNDISCHMAKEIGVKMVISTDAHSISQLDYMNLGVTIARRGWLEKENIINTYPLSKLKKLLNRK